MALRNQIFDCGDRCQHRLSPGRFERAVRDDFLSLRQEGSCFEVKRTQPFAVAQPDRQHVRNGFLLFEVDVFWLLVLILANDEDNGAPAYE